MRSMTLAFCLKVIYKQFKVGRFNGSPDTLHTCWTLKTEWSAFPVTAQLSICRQHSTLGLINTYFYLILRRQSKSIDSRAIINSISFCCVAGRYVTTKTTTMQPASVREKQCKWLATRVSCSLITYSHVQNISGKSRKLSWRKLKTLNI